MRNSAIAGAISAVLATAAFGQSSSLTNYSTSSTSGRIAGSAGFAGPRYAGPVVAGAPYSGEEVGEQVQTLADGTHITHTQPWLRVFRDSQGRTRTERPLAFNPNGGSADTAVIIEITDSVAGYGYALDATNKVAHRFALKAPDDNPNTPRLRLAPGNAVFNATTGGTSTVMTLPPPTTLPPPPARAPVPATISRSGDFIAVAAPNGAMRPEVTNESLGTQVIQGVVCEGRRNTMVWPVGSQGNDRPITVVSEVWTSPELKLTVLSKNNDPRSGENTHKLINVSLTEPDASLFMPAAGYTVVDESGPFTINYMRQ